MTIQYEEIYDAFLGKCTDYSFADLDEESLHESWDEYFRSCIAKPHVRELFSSIVLDDGMAEVDAELKDSVDEDSDRRFATEVFAKGMVVEWMEPQVKNVVNIAQMFGGKEEKFYAQANHLSQLQLLLSEAKTDFYKMIRDYGYYHSSYLAGGSS